MPRGAHRAVHLSADAPDLLQSDLVDLARRAAGRGLDLHAVRVPCAPVRKAAPSDRRACARDVRRGEVRLQPTIRRSHALGVFPHRFRRQSIALRGRDGGGHVREWQQQRAPHRRVWHERLDLRRYGSECDARRRHADPRTAVEQDHRLLDQLWKRREPRHDVLVVGRTHGRHARDHARRVLRPIALRDGEQLRGETRAIHILLRVALEHVEAEPVGVAQSIAIDGAQDHEAIRKLVTPASDRRERVVGPPIVLPRSTDDGRELGRVHHRVLPVEREKRLQACAVAHRGARRQLDEPAVKVGSRRRPLRVRVLRAKKQRDGGKRDRESSCAHAFSPVAGVAARGTVRISVAPTPSALSARSSPPMPRARSRLIARPSPAPSDGVVSERSS